MTNNATGMFDFAVLRDIRKAKGLSIKKVSQRAGVSISVISKLERNQTVAELETLFRISRVFGINATDLISLAELRTTQKKTAGEYISGDFTFQRVSYANLECYHGSARAGATVSRAEMHHDDYEVCWVLQGKMRIALSHEIHKLAAGDALQFDGILEHTYEALEDCEIVIMHLDKGKRF